MKKLSNENVKVDEKEEWKTVTLRDGQSQLEHAEAVSDALIAMTM